MTLIELNELLKSLGVPVAYSHFNTPVKLPFITYLEVGSTNFIADNKVFKKVIDVDIELYTNKKDLEIELLLEQLLSDNEIPYDTVENYIDDEKVLQKIYEVRLIK